MIDATVVGLGAMGLPVLRRLEAAGYQVAGVEPDGGRRARAGEVPTYGSVVDAPPSRVVIVFVATPAQLATVVESAPASLTGQTWVVMGTVGPDAVTAAAASIRERGGDLVDAPVTGGVAGAESGGLLIFASGSPESLAITEPVLRHLGRPVAVGDVGAGQVMKVVNQHLCAVHLVAAAEALGLADRMGLDLGQVLELLPQGAAGSWMLADRGPLMADPEGPPAVRSAIDVFVKDAGLVAEAATAAGVSTPVLDAVRGVLADASADGGGLRDDSRLIDSYR